MPDQHATCPAPVDASIRIDLPADKALRLECLRLAARDYASLDEVLAHASSYADFVLAGTTMAPEASNG